LRVFLDTLPLDRRFSIEFRHESWFEDDVFDVLRARDIELCITEQPEFASPVVATASWGYARLHKVSRDVLTECSHERAPRTRARNARRALRGKHSRCWLGVHTRAAAYTRSDKRRPHEHGVTLEIA
jgi:uncharacterized protein YecE (DUF72 family)